MQLKEIMTRRVEVVHPDTTIQEAARKMKALDVGPMPVCDGERLVGMVTDRDITIRATAQGLDPCTATVREVMTKDVIWCLEDESIETAARLMEQNQIRRLLVLGSDKRLAGIVSLADLAVDTGEDEMTAQLLERVSEPATPER